MSSESVIFFLLCIILVLIAVVCYQQFAFTRGIQAKLREVSGKLSDIMEQDTDEKVMVFTENEVLMDLCGQINRILIDRQKIKTDYRKQEMSTRTMLANVSHDLKTPLTVILGYLEMMRMDWKEDETLRKVELKAKQVLELMNEFFTLAKLEAGDVNLRADKINVSELCRESVIGFYELLIQQEFTVDLSIPEQSLFVRGDRESIERILNNLISNAIRYGGDGNYIGILIREETDFILIDVVDRGKGIGKEFAANVFERLYTMEDSRSRKVQGNGLGLTIAQNLARQMGGDLVLCSKPHVKTVFTVKLPRFC